MSWKGTVFLLLILAALGGYVYWTEIRGQADREEADRKKDRVFDFKEDDVEKIDVFTKMDESAPVVIERAGADKKDWRISAPLQTEADKSSVDGFLSSLVYLTSQRDVDENPKDLAQYGLKDPRHYVSLWLKGKKEPLSLRIGEKSTIGNSYYAMRSDAKKVMILDSSFESSLSKGLFDFRDKNVFPIEDEKARRIEVRREKDSVVLEKSADGTWRLREPLDVVGSKSTVEDVLRELKNAQATKFVAEEVTDGSLYGFDKPQVLVKVDFEGTAMPAELTIGKKGDVEADYYAHASMKKPVVMVNEYLFKSLTKESAEFREKHAVTFDHYEVQKLSLVYPDKTFDLLKSGEDAWKLDAPEKADADASQVDNVLYAVDGLEAKEFVDKPDKNQAAYGLDKPRAKIQIWQKGDKEPREVWIGNADAARGLTYIKNPKLGNILLVETTQTEELFPKLDDLKKKPENAAVEEATKDE
ncbi:MAG: DUF4340 domain-containing protein [Acidobacteriota bacterium]